jgi:hypothetical protein
MNRQQNVHDWLTIHMLLFYVVSLIADWKFMEAWLLVLWHQVASIIHSNPGSSGASAYMQTTLSIVVRRLDLGLSGRV